VKLCPTQNQIAVYGNHESGLETVAEITNTPLLFFLAKTPFCCVAGGSPARRRVVRVKRLVVENDVQKRAVDLQPAVVVNESHFPEPVHEEADPRAGGADHFRQHRLTDLGNYRLGLAFLAKMSEQQQDSGQPFFARIEKLIHQIFFITDVPL